MPSCFYFWWLWEMRRGIDGVLKIMCNLASSMLILLLFSPPIFSPGQLLIQAHNTKILFIYPVWHDITPTQKHFFPLHFFPFEFPFLSICPNMNGGKWPRSNLMIIWPQKKQRCCPTQKRSAGRDLFTMMIVIPCTSRIIVGQTKSHLQSEWNEGKKWKI